MVTFVVTNFGPFFVICFTLKRVYWVSNYNLMTFAAFQITCVEVKGTLKFSLLLIIYSLSFGRINLIRRRKFYKLLITCEKLYLR